MLRDIRAQVFMSTRTSRSPTFRISKHGSSTSRNRPAAFCRYALQGLRRSGPCFRGVGLYSVVSYGVAPRTNEFGIRMALGAKATDVFRLVLSSTTMSVGAGLATGLVLSLAFNKLSTKWVNESSHDPLILAGVTLLLVAAALRAAFVPARRAASVVPMVALRYE